MQRREWLPKAGSTVVASPRSGWRYPYLPCRRAAWTWRRLGRLIYTEYRITQIRIQLWDSMPLWLSESDVRAVLAPGELIAVMDDALGAFSAGRVTQPVRTALEIGDRSFFAVMPAFQGE